MRLVALAERPDLRGAFDAPGLEPWPEFLYYDSVSSELVPRLATDFPDYQIALLDGRRMVAKGASIPFRWTADDYELPDGGLGAVLQQGFGDLDVGRAPSAASAVEIVVASDRLGRGLSQVMVRGLRDVAARHGLSALFAPVRPNHKSRYPLTPIDEYITWTLADGVTPFDPWLRVHWRLGSRVVRVCSHSMVVTGTVSQWEEWTGLPMPASGRYVVPGALCPIEVDRSRDTAHYIEPNVWVRHDTHGS
jgi:hypothetical protein